MQDRYKNIPHLSPRTKLIMAASGAILLLSCAKSDQKKPISQTPYQSQDSKVCTPLQFAEGLVTVDEVKKAYSDWKQKFTTSKGAGGGIRVVRPNGDYTDQYKEDTVSEGIAYGMIFSAYLNDKPTFDGLWRYAQSHSLGTDGQMAWRIDKDNQVINKPNINGQASATDATHDIAISLLKAGKNWGEEYTQAAIHLIRKSLQSEVEEKTYVVKPGNNWGGSDVLNLSYLSTSYYELFNEVTGNKEWIMVKGKSYEIIETINRSNNKKTGLVPDWSTSDGKPVSGFSYDYSYDATRTPLRLALDAFWHCDPNALKHLTTLNTFFQGVIASGGVNDIGDKYGIDGTKKSNNHNSAFIGPLAAAAMYSSDSQYRRLLIEDLNRLKDEDYYPASLKVFTLLFLSGSLKNP